MQHVLVYTPIEAKAKKDKKKEKRGWALQWKRGLVIKAPGVKLKLSKDQLLLGGLVVTGGLIMLTPAGPVVTGAIAKMATTAGRVGLSALSKAASFAAKSGVSLAQAAKQLGISESKLKEELEKYRQTNPDEYEAFINALLSEGAKEATFYKEPSLFGQTLSSPLVIITGMSILGLLGMTYLITRRKK